MSVLLDIPSALFADIVTKFIELEELVQFDSACTNHRLRRLLLDEYPRLPCTEEFPLSSLTILSFHYYNWIIAKGMKINRCCLDTDSFFGRRKLMNTTDFSHVLSITAGISKSVKRAIIQIVNRCVNLKTLVCVGSEDIICDLSSHILRDLQVLVAGYDEKKIPDTVKKIASSCSNLTKVAFPFLITSEQFESIVSTNPKLVDVSLGGFMELVEFIARSCPFISNCKVLLKEPFNLKYPLLIIKNNPNSVLRLKYAHFSVAYDGLHQRLVLFEYPNTDNDLDDFVAAAKNLKFFEAGCNSDEGADYVTDSMVASIVDNSFRTLHSFICHIDRVSVPTIRRMLVECSLLTTLILIDVKNDIVEAFEDLPVSAPLETLKLETHDMKMSTVTCALGSFRRLKQCMFGIVRSQDLDLDDLHKQLMEYYYGKDDIICCEFTYQFSHYLKTVSFDGLFFTNTAKIDVFDLAF